MQLNQRPGENDAIFFLRGCGYASIAACFAEYCTIPLDTAKVRLQTQVVEAGQVPRYNGMFGTIKTIAAQEGPFTLWNGIIPGLQRQIINAGLRVGLYLPIRNMFTGELQPGENPSLLAKVGAGLVSGAIGISVANPTDVVKIRL